MEFINIVYSLVYSIFVNLMCQFLFLYKIGKRSVIINNLSRLCKSETTVMSVVYVQFSGRLCWYFFKMEDGVPRVVFRVRSKSELLFSLCIILFVAQFHLSSCDYTPFLFGSVPVEKSPSCDIPIGPTCLPFLSIWREKGCWPRFSASTVSLRLHVCLVSCRTHDVLLLSRCPGRYGSSVHRHIPQCPSSSSWVCHSASTSVPDLARAWGQSVFFGQSHFVYRFFKSAFRTLERSGKIFNFVNN